MENGTDDPLWMSSLRSCPREMPVKSESLPRAFIASAPEPSKTSLTLGTLAAAADEVGGICCFGGGGSLSGAGKGGRACARMHACHPWNRISDASLLVPFKSICHRDMVGEQTWDSSATPCGDAKSQTGRYSYHKER